jgi:hypothetical protein
MSFRIVWAFLLFLLLTADGQAAAPRWDTNSASRWYAAQSWLVGANFIPKNAVNSLEMWQRETFDLPEINRELGYAEALGMNTMRVFLHDLVWKNDRDEFIKRVDAFLTVAARHHIRPVFVLFDSCWDPAPLAGRQPAPRIGVHNSRWVQSPGYVALSDSREYPRLEAYIRGIVGTFANDSRILAWDVWNEPDNGNGGSYNDPDAKLGFVKILLPLVFEWARSAEPIQPLTSAVWNGNWSTDDSLRQVERVQISLSDVISFHNYGSAEDFTARVNALERFHRPILLTEYMARPLGSTFAAILPIAHDHRIGAFNWGFVAGRTQTFDPWDSWVKPYPKEGPPVWFHDILFSDGTPYRPEETNFIRSMISRFRKAISGR